MELYAFGGGKCITEGKPAGLPEGLCHFALLSEREMAEQLEIDWVSLLQYFKIEFIE